MAGDVGYQNERSQRVSSRKVEGKITRDCGDKRTIWPTPARVATGRSAVPRSAGIARRTAPQCREFVTRLRTQSPQSGRRSIATGLAPWNRTARLSNQQSASVSKALVTASITRCNERPEINPAKSVSLRRPTKRYQRGITQLGFVRPDVHPGLCARLGRGMPSAVRGVEVTATTRMSSSSSGSMSIGLTTITGRRFARSPSSGGQSSIQ